MWFSKEGEKVDIQLSELLKLRMNNGEITQTFI